MTVQEAARPDRRQRRWHEMHDRLYEAACALFLESDFVGTSVDEIAERADVARKTAFNHFPRKKDFIGEWGKRRRRRVEAALSADLKVDPTLDVMLRSYFAELAAINVDERALTIRMSSGWRQAGGPFDADPHTLAKVFEGFVRDAVVRGEISAAVDPARIATVLYSSYFGLLYEWCEGADDEPPFDLGEEFTRFLDVILAGLRSL